MNIFPGHLFNIIEVNSHLIRCNACRREFDELQEASDKLKGIGFTEPQDSVLNKLWKSPHSRLTRNTGLFLVIGGWLALVIYGLYEAFITPDEALIPKVMLAVIIAGFAVLTHRGPMLLLACVSPHP